MHTFNHSNRLRSTLLYAAYGWLLLSGSLQIGVDIASQYLRGKRAPGPATTSYYGLNSAYGISQILFALLALFAIRQGVVAMGQWSGNSLGLFCSLRLVRAQQASSLNTRSHARR